MTRMTRQEVLEVLGELDELMVSRLIATGADTSTLLATLRGVEHEVRYGERLEPIHTPEADQVREILYELLDEEITAEQATD
jgi:hypothetical protein